MEAAKVLLPYRNGSLNADGSHFGWNVRKFHSILNKSMDLLLYGWSENMVTQSGESAHKVNCIVIITHTHYTLLHTFTHYLHYVSTSQLYNDKYIPLQVISLCADKC